MASIQKRISSDGTVSYRVRVRVKGRPIQTETFRRLTDARQWGQKTEANLREARHFPTREARRRTLAELIDRYSARVLPAKRESTQRPQRQHLAWWRDRIGSLTLVDLTPSSIADCRDRLIAGGCSPATANRYLAALSHAFTYAVRDLGWVEANPCQKVTKAREPRGRARFLTPDERRRLLDACQASRNPLLYPAVLLALSTGMRQGEQMSLTWDRVDLTTGRIRLDDTKNGERRTVAVTGPALEALRQLGAGGATGGHVFPGHIPGKPIDLRAPFVNALAEAGIEDFRWHDLRHSFASELAMSGATLAEIAEAMGHKTLQMVKRYAHLTEGHIGGVVARMTERVFG